mmetsp:Transcript_55828/g.88478  ORF Transcript_55828/g.88478 Transcript_55828/m.88478 type:complete len:234 (+) Transcript_55828:47-748(+)
MKQYWFLDVSLGCVALASVIYRAYQLEALMACLSFSCLLEPSWWLCEFGICLNYIMHGMIWNFPGTFTSLSQRFPLKLLGGHPVEVFASLEVVAKLVQAVSLLLFLGTSGRSALLAAVFASPLWCWVACIVCVALGQTLNVAMYGAIGNAGVYYGFKLGREIDWCHGFPFNVGLRHPQYVGVVLTLWGALTVVLSKELADIGLPQVVLVWGSMYGFMSAMEQVGDNEKEDKSK